MASHQLHSSLLRAPIAQILRAAGFHSARSSVIDTLVNIAERHLLLLASATAAHAYSNHNSPVPTVTDVRMALTECGVLTSCLSAAEEEWKERFRRPYEEYDDLPFGAVRREKELQRRDEEDTRDVREFIAWITGDKNKEIRRVAGMLPEMQDGIAGGVGAEMKVAPDDYLTALKKKNARTGQEERFAGTVLGRQAEDREVKIEGGPVESLREWALELTENGMDGVAGAKTARISKDYEMADAPS